MDKLWDKQQSAKNKGSKEAIPERSGSEDLVLRFGCFAKLHKLAHLILPTREVPTGHDEI